MKASVCMSVHTRKTGTDTFLLSISLIVSHLTQLPVTHRFILDVILLLPDSNVSSFVAELHARLVSNLEEPQKLIDSKNWLAQQRMKLHYGNHSAPATFNIGSKV